MKRTNTILAIILLVMTGCGENKQSQDDVITVDVTKSYPEKELILQDFMDVEYIALETTDEFLTQGIVKAVGKEIIVVSNIINDGDIFIFDRKTGKGIRKINRKGQGGEEYTRINEIVLDEDNKEMFVNNTYAHKILVYDLSGNFKRSLKFTEDDQYSWMFNYDKDNLICYDNSGTYKYGEDRGNKSYHVILSKQDGSIVREIFIPFTTLITPLVRTGDGIASNSIQPIIPYNGNFLLIETSSDTVYTCMPDAKLTPCIIRTPSIQTMDSEIFISAMCPTDLYYFFQTMKKEFDFSIGRGFPRNHFMYDRQANEMYKYVIFNDEYTVKKQIYLTLSHLNHEIATYQRLEAYQLVEAYEKGELKGRLKEIAATLDQEDNPVIMLLKHKR
jgi:hypothetical protein